MSPQELQQVIDGMAAHPEKALAALLAEEKTAMVAEARAQWYAAQAALSVKETPGDFLLWQRDVRLRNRYAGPDGVLQGARYENFEVSTDAQRFALESVQGEHWPVPDETWHLLTLSGPPGTGKSHLGAAWFTAQSVADMRAHFIDARALLERLKHARGAALDDLMRHFAEGQRAFMPGDHVTTALFGARHLVLDNLGSDPMSTREVDLITEIIDARTSLGSLHTLITTRCSRVELRTRLGERCLSRIESGPWVPMTGEDQRAMPPRPWMTTPGDVPLPGLSPAEIDQQLKAYQAHAEQASQTLAAKSAHLALVRHALARLIHRAPVQAL